MVSCAGLSALSRCFTVRLLQEIKPSRKDQRREQRGELKRVRGPDRQQLWPAAPEKMYISQLTKYLSTGRKKNTTFHGIKTVKM